MRSLEKKVLALWNLIKSFELIFCFLKKHGLQIMKMINSFQLAFSQKYLDLLALTGSINDEVGYFRITT